MKAKIKIFILSLLLPIHVFAFQYAPQDLLQPWYVKLLHKVEKCTWHISCYTQKNVGAFTDISSATVISNFPSIYNANLDITMEVGTTSVASITTLNSLTSASSLATVGTLTSGSLGSGFTAVPVSLGGTGTTSPTSNQVMLGNGSSGFKVVSGLGTSGQFLTSAGAGNPPTWTTSAIDTAGTYSWTGPHTFGTNVTTFNAGFLATASSTHTATTTFAASSVTNNAVVFRGVPYAFPSAITASSTALMTDASGNLSWNYPIASHSSGTTTIDPSSACSGTLSVAHGLGRVPKFVKLHAVYTPDTTSSAISSSDGSWDGTDSASVTIRSSGAGNTSAAGASTNAFEAYDTVGTTGNCVGTITVSSTNIQIALTLSGTMTAGSSIQIYWDAQ